MSRSLRKTPIFGHTRACSEKQDKRQAHQAERAQVRTRLQSSKGLEELDVSAKSHAYSDVWSFAKDGKSYSPLRVQRQGRALKVLAKPRWLQTERDVHRAMGK